MANGTSTGGLNAVHVTAAQWCWVDRGLMIKQVAIGLFALLFLFISALAVAHPQTLWTSRVGYTLGIVMLTAIACDITSGSLCLMSPVALPSRIPIAGSIGCELAAIILFVTALTAIPELGLAGRILIGVLLAGSALALATLFFLMFARNIAVSLGRDDLAFSPISVLILFGGTFSTSAMIIVIVCVLLLCPCMWWPIYIALVVLQKGWQEYGLPEALLWPLVRLVPVLFCGLLCFGSLYRYFRLVSQLRGAGLAGRKPQGASPGLRCR